MPLTHVTCISSVLWVTLLQVIVTYLMNFMIEDADSSLFVTITTTDPLNSIHVLTVHCTWPFFFSIQISGCKDNSAFIEVIHSDAVLDCLGQAGSNGLPQFENREKLLAELCHYFVIDKVRSALEQFKEGLASLNVLQLMRSHPKLLKWVFSHGQSPLTSSTMDGIFVPSYSEEGTRQRDQEEIVIMHWSFKTVKVRIAEMFRI